MDDIHTPTVESGPTSNGVLNGQIPANLSLLELMDRRDAVEAELKALSSVLQSHGVHMSTGLTTIDGFPRSDIDVAQIRTTRVRIIHLRNDYKELMGRIEKGLHAHHAAIRERGAQDASTTSGLSASSPAGISESSLEAPFAKVNSVADGSPAHTAGLRAGDKITNFGIVDWTNHERLSKVAEVVQQNEGRPLVVKGIRGVSGMTFTLTPRQNWGGRGMLGCHLVPI
ncbi:hypothetical protein P152DRAFT_461305 [Eremomyces bilateralis CBS 781.70]|uniref:Probable 26S proteasome regulatory subunit p27 n=1 Tax=Eremomyces bilateralis CBS 781.70 TaxID=1392243 RepID=A0A6G1FV87_9PEZI|nr:uncharacterized protein P152DRAFT_461305 [Eremomyces bilateralis CBS 781.70]KAF1809618.1 hypothetical protein P152DRAFT_461305 [Eremomyces bilateralis CBS 781.70]